MVHAHYCAPYPKWPCVEHEVNMWCPCCITLSILEPSTLFSQVLWPMLWPHHQIVTNVKVWPITSDPNPNCSKNRKIKIRQKNKINKVYSLRSWQHEYRRYNKYWNLRRNMISHFILFLEFNCNTFTFALCYNLKLELRLHLGKDLRGDKEFV